MPHDSQDEGGAGAEAMTPLHPDQVKVLAIRAGLVASLLALAALAADLGPLRRTPFAIDPSAGFLAAALLAPAVIGVLRWRKHAHALGGMSKRRDGFTLVELMVVIVIIGLAAAAVVLTLPERGGGLHAEAERFAARAKAARDDAILDSRAASVTVGPGGYDVVRRRGAVHYDWVEGTRAELSGRIRFDPTGLAEPARLTLRRGERSAAVDIGEDGHVEIR